MDNELQPETVPQTADRVLEHLRNTKQWALAKASAIEARIAAVGGEVPPALHAVLDEIRAEVGAAE